MRWTGVVHVVIVAGTVVHIDDEEFLVLVIPAGEMAGEAEPAPRSDVVVVTCAFE